MVSASVYATGSMYVREVLLLLATELHDGL